MLRSYVFNELVFTGNPWHTLIAISQLYDIMKIRIKFECKKLSPDNIVSYCSKHNISNFGELRRFRNAVSHNIINVYKISEIMGCLRVEDIYSVIVDLNISYDMELLESRFNSAHTFIDYAVNLVGMDADVLEANEDEEL